MSVCATCAARVDSAAAFCPRCGASTPRPLPRRGRVVAVALAALAAVVGVGWPAWAAWRATSGCEPQGWEDWHRAMQRSCLTPEYVCRNMTSAKLLEDPAVADELRRALESGDTSAMGSLESLVDGMRSQYGCGSASAHGGTGSGSELPPGHPPIGPGHPRELAPRFDAPSGVDI